MPPCGSLPFTACFCTLPQTLMTFLMAPTLMTFLMAQANFEPTFSSINILTIRKPSYYSSYLHAYEDGTDRVFRKVGIQNSDAGELPRRKHRAFTTRRKFEIKMLVLSSGVNVSRLWRRMLGYINAGVLLTSLERIILQTIRTPNAADTSKVANLKSF
jgi:hypothetical protein